MQHILLPGLFLFLWRDFHPDPLANENPRMSFHWKDHMERNST